MLEESGEGVGTAEDAGEVEGGVAPLGGREGGRE